MKKITFLLMILLFNFCYAIEETPLYMDSSVINIQYEENNNNLINTKKMKKTDKVEKAKENTDKNRINKIKIDERQLRMQRTLDYSTKQMNSALPLF